MRLQVCLLLLCRHSLHAIATQLSPVLGCTGIELLKADTFDLHCFQTLTGTKMIMVVEPGTPDVDILLKDTYVRATCLRPFLIYDMRPVTHARHGLLNISNACALHVYRFGNLIA